MILIIGGAYQGKTEYAIHTYGLSDDEVLVCNENTVIDEGIYQDKVILEGIKCITNLNEWIRSEINYHGDNAEEIIKGKMEKLLINRKNIIIIMNEVGMGIVPIDRKDRDYREIVGRTGCLLASKADKVVRVCCSCGQVIKG